ncbi:hypothetical protein F5Y15DRAFT_124115 [Xylariaceae sp. FL0016]|nr:hypothetical protein F5Y15DRAFT_124115 [Xylariaceae sp. FL0016]
MMALTKELTPEKSKAHVGFLDLPDEIQAEIFAHVKSSQCALICSSLVCHRFRELAAAQLYRNFHIVFPDEDDPFFESPIDGLAGGLDTFVTSDYNYAKHLRDFSLDTLSAGPKAETAYKPYLAKVSCGKFMNTLLLLTLRRAVSLDTFRWNIRVELSKPVYKALRNLRSLRHLHIRLHAGPSALNVQPPALPYAPPSVHIGSYPPAYSGLGFPPMHSVLGLGHSSAVPSTSPTTYEPLVKPTSFGKPLLPKEPLTIGAFKNLESLSVLDVDDLDIITELQACVRNSSSSLKKLSLSFSNALAAKARKPCLDPIDADDSDGEDTDGWAPLVQTSNPADPAGPAKTFRAREEKRVQESVLGRVFGVEPFIAKQYQVAMEEKLMKSAKKPEDHPSNAAEIWDMIEQISVMLHNPPNIKNSNHRGLFDAFKKAAALIDESQEIPAESTTGLKTGVVSSLSEDSTDEKVITPATEESQNATRSKLSYGSRSPTANEEMNPDDIDVAAPEEQQLSLDPQVDSTIDESTANASPIAIPNGPTSESRTNVSNNIVSGGLGSANWDAQRRKMRPLGETVQSLKREADQITKEKRTIDTTDEDADIRSNQRLETISRNVTDIEHERNVIEAEIEDSEAHAAHDASQAIDREEIYRLASEYARNTRGIGLHCLNLHMIPIKTSVLARALDLHTLKRITLLNVGDQAPFWKLMKKENALQPLQLRKIFTDNASLPLLQLVSELECLHELFLLERSPKYRPQSFAEKTQIKLEQIRNLILKKHAQNFKRLMIRNDADNSWDMDNKTIKLICRRGRQLEELAVAMGMGVVHTFIQHMAGLVNLRALQVVALRHEDTCLSVTREVKNFIVDVVSLHTEMKLEWVAVAGHSCSDKYVMRIMRKTDGPEKDKKNKTKGKGNGKEVVNYNANADASLLPLPTAAGWDSPSDSEEDEDFYSGHNNLDVCDSIAYCDVWGVRLFTKEIQSGRL